MKCACVFRGAGMKSTFWEKFPHHKAGYRPEVVLVIVVLKFGRGLILCFNTKKKKCKVTGKIKLDYFAWL